MDENKKEAPQAEEAEEPKAPAAEVPAEEPEKKADRKDKKRDRKKEADKAAEKIAELEAQLAAGNDRYLRVCAEYDNFRRRSQKEKDGLYGEVKADTIQKFLPVYDNLERALKQGAFFLNRAPRTRPTARAWSSSWRSSTPRSRSSASR